MTSSRLLKALAFLSLFCVVAAAWIWHATGEPPDHWLLRIAGTSFFAALIVAIVSPDTRPRMLMRFLAALFAVPLMGFVSQYASFGVSIRLASVGAGAALLLLFLTRRQVGE